MAIFIGKRLISLVLSLIAASLVVFFVIEVIPGD
ncbi:MAG TPA: ABC transporter permease, partial [Devosia sp.]|nr:ABC transporter permease [Devosia sp.]